MDETVCVQKKGVQKIRKFAHQCTKNAIAQKFDNPKLAPLIYVYGYEEGSSNNIG